LDELLLLLFRRDLLPLLSDAVPPSLATLAVLPARFRAGAGVREILVVARAILKSLLLPLLVRFLNCWRFNLCANCYRLGRLTQ